MMQFGFCDLAVVPVRREPSDKAEMSTQLLFGDILEILGRSGTWVEARILFDGYQGWVESKQICEIGEDSFHRLAKSPVFVNRQLNADAIRLNGELIRLPGGCSFYELKDQSMEIEGREYFLEGKAYPFTPGSVRDILKTARDYLSCPYMWGGKTYMGMDCSGLTQVVYRQHGIGLLRDAVQQSGQGELINLVSDALPGDLAFFDNQEGSICHVGILLENQQILHCSGKVRIDQVDHQGIFNRELNRYTHNLRLVRRVVG